MLLVYFGKQRRIGATFPKMFSVGQGHATTQRGAMETTNHTQPQPQHRPRPQPQPQPPQHLTAVTLVSAKRTINWVILQTRRTAASIGTVGLSITRTTSALEATSLTPTSRLATSTSLSTAATGSFVTTATRIVRHRTVVAKSINVPLQKMGSSVRRSVPPTTANALEDTGRS